MSFHKINECGVERGQVLIKVTISFNYSYVVNECGVKTRVSFVYTQVLVLLGMPGIYCQSYSNPHLIDWCKLPKLVVFKKITGIIKLISFNLGDLH